MSILAPIVSAITGNKAANSQADAARDAQATATDEQRRQFDVARSDSAPWRATGKAALDKLARLYGLNPSSGDTGQVYNPTTGSMEQRPADASGSSPDMSVFQESPDYQFNLAEGQKALNNSLIAKGRGLSGAAVKAGIRYASGAASTQFNDFYNRLAGIAGVGQTANQQSAALGANAANQIGSYAINAGNAIGNARASAFKNLNDITKQQGQNADSFLGYAFGGGNFGGGYGG